jgi:hypothetical protein
LAEAWKRLWIAAIPTTLIMILMMVHMFWVPAPGYLAIVAVLAFPVVFLYGGFATHRSAWRSLTNRTANMDVLISMGSLPPYLIGLVGFVYPMTSFIEMAATIMTFHLLGRYLETRAKGRASQAIRRLVTLGAKTATVVRDGEEVEVPVAEALRTLLAGTGFEFATMADHVIIREERLPPVPTLTAGWPTSVLSCPIRRGKASRKTSTNGLTNCTRRRVPAPGRARLFCWNGKIPSKPSW